MTRSAKDMNEAYQQLDKEDKKVDSCECIKDMNTCQRLSFLSK